MKAPVCEICLKSGLLCRSCDDKVKTGKVSHTEVKVSELLLKLSEERKSIKDVTIKKVSETDEMAVIICGKSDAPKIIGASGQNVKKLEKELGKRVKVVEEARDINEFVQSVLSPLQVVSVNTLYKNGKEALKIVTRGKGQRISARDFSDIMKAMYGKEAEIAGE